jgi:tRNA-splicing ligase RtcB
MSELAPLFTWLIEPMEAPVVAAIERLRRCDDVESIAVMPDVHLGKEVCVGVVLATRRLLYPAAVGGDIGCGMLALAVDAPAELLEDAGRAAQLLGKLYTAIPGTRRHRSRTIASSLELSALRLSHPALEAVRKAEGSLQLGTLGGGNHFVEFQRDAEGRLWLMVHSGSRGLGQAIRDHHVSRSVKVSGPLTALDAQTDLGRAYLNDVAVARLYARESRLAMAASAGRLLRELFGAEPFWPTVIHCDHNHVALESHFGQELYVHRKGAMPAAGGLPGVLPGSMGSPSFHVEGRGEPRSLCSCAHGAGRALSRHAARERFSARELARQMKGTWFDYRMSGHLLEEAPRAYKDIEAVVRASRELVRVVRKLHPMLIYKAR